MAYELTIDRRYPEADTYRGPAERFEANLSGPSLFPFTDDIVAKLIEWFPPEGADKLMRLRIWQDKSPFWTDLYRVEVIAHGSPIAWAAIIAGLAALILITIISWNVAHIDWGGAAGVAIGIGVALLALVLIVSSTTRRKK